MSVWISRVMTDQTYSRSISEEVKLARGSGCGIRRLVTLCGTVTQLVAEHDRRFPGSESDDDGDDEDMSPQKKAEVQRWHRQINP